MASNQNRQCQGGRNRPRHHKTSKVNFPNGGSMAITIPATPCTCTTCKFNSKLILLRPEGSFGKREYNIVVNEMNSTIMQHSLQERGGGRFTSYSVVSVHKVQNGCLWRKFRDRERQIASEAGHVNEKMLFHGTTAADNIVKVGFDKTFAKPTGMFGTGIYFAEHSSKSNQYTYGPLGGNGCPNHKDKNCYRCVRTILLCRVALGRMYELKMGCSLQAPPAGYHSVSGIPSPTGLQYPEYAIYNVDQVYPEYLIRYKIRYDDEYDEEYDEEYDVEYDDEYDEECDEEYDDESDDESHEEYDDESDEESSVGQVDPSPAKWVKYDDECNEETDDDCDDESDGESDDESDGESDDESHEESSVGQVDPSPAKWVKYDDECDDESDGESDDESDGESDDESDEESDDDYDNEYV